MTSFWCSKCKTNHPDECPPAPTNDPAPADASEPFGTNVPAGWSAMKPTAPINRTRAIATADLLFLLRYMTDDELKDVYDKVKGQMILRVTPTQGPVVRMIP